MLPESGGGPSPAEYDCILIRAYHLSAVREICWQDADLRSRIDTAYRTSYDSTKNLAKPK